MNESVQHAQELRDVKQRRLDVLELQEAQYGLEVPAHIVLEIESLRKEIQHLQGVIDGAMTEENAGTLAADVLALDLVRRQLNPVRGIPAPTLDELKTALTAASETVIETIVREAENVRTATWRADKAKMELVIPIFRALMARDSQEHYYHGRLGHALKDSRTPDWAEAEYELSKAIDLRANRYPGKFRFYETNRAICRIMQDAEFQHSQPSRAVAEQFILKDLRAAVQNDPRTKRVISEDTTIKEWMRLNNVTLEQLE